MSDILVKVGADISNFSRNISKATQDMSSMGKASNGLTFGKLLGAVGITAAVAKGFNMVKESVGRAFSRIDTMEQFERVMTTMTGSSKKAQSVLDDVNETVKGTAYGLDVGAKAVQSFVTSNMDVDKATMTFAAWGDAVAFYGDGTNETLGSVTDALAKATAKGKIQMDTMNRLAEAGIPAMQIYADATGQSVEDVANQMQKGQLKADEFINVMNDAMMNGTKSFESIKGAAKEAGASWSGSFDNMRAAVARGVIAIIQNIDEMLTSNGLPDMREMVAMFGAKFEEVLKKAADAIPKVVGKLKEVYNTLEPWLPLLGSLAAAFGTVFTAVAAYNTIKGIIDAVKASQVALNIAAMMNPWGLVAMAVIAAVALIYIYWEPISEFFIKLWEKIKVAGIAVWDWMKGVWQSTVEFFVGVWDGVSGFFTDLWDSIKEIATSIWDSVKETWQSTVDSVERIWNSVKTFFTVLWDTIKEKATSIWDGIVEAVTTAVDNIKTTFEPMTTFFSDTFERVFKVGSSVFENLVGFLENTWENIKIIAESAWEIIKNVILGPILLLIDLVTGDFEGFKEDLKAIWTNISEAAGEIWNAIKDIVMDYVTTLWESAKEVFFAWVDTVAEAFGAVLDTFDNIWTNIKTVVDDHLLKLEEAFNNAMDAIYDVLVNAWNYIDGLWRDALSLILGDSIDNFEEIKHAIEDAMEAVWTIIETVWDFVKDTFSNAVGFIMALVRGDFAVMKDFIDQQMTLIKDTIKVIWDNVKKIFFSVLKAVWGIVKEKFAQIKQWAIDKLTEAAAGIKVAWDNAKRATAEKIAAMLAAVIDKFNKIRQAAKDKMNEAKQNIEDAWNKAVKFLKNIDLVKIGKDVIQGFIKGIKSKVKDVASAAKEAADAVTGKIKSILKIASPSRVLAQIGRWTGEGLAKGIVQTTNLVGRATAKLAEAATPDAPAISLAYDTPSGIRSSLSSAVSGTVDVNARDDMIAAAIASLERKLDGLIVEMDGETVGRIVRPHVNDGNALDATVRRYFD